MRKSSYFCEDVEYPSDEHSTYHNQSHNTNGRIVMRQDFSVNFAANTVCFPLSNIVLWNSEIVEPNAGGFVFAVETFPQLLLKGTNIRKILENLLDLPCDASDVVDIVHIPSLLQDLSIPAYATSNSVTTKGYALSFQSSSSTIGTGTCLTIPVSGLPPDSKSLRFDRDSSISMIRNLIKTMHSGRSLTLKSCYRIRAIGKARESVIEFSGSQLTGTVCFEAIMPDVSFQVALIRPLPMLATALCGQLMQIGSSNSPHPLSAVASGYLTLNQTRKLVPLMDSDGALSRTPTVGVWVRFASPGSVEGVASLVKHPFAWAACVRYLANDLVRDRRFVNGRSADLRHPVMENETFLLVIIVPGRATLCYEVTRLRTGHGNISSTFDPQSFLASESDFVTVHCSLDLTASHDLCEDDARGFLMARFSPGPSPRRQESSRMTAIVPAVQRSVGCSVQRQESHTENTRFAVAAPWLMPPQVTRSRSSSSSASNVQQSPTDQHEYHSSISASARCGQAAGTLTAEPSAAENFTPSPRSYCPVPVQSSVQSQSSVRLPRSIQEQQNVRSANFSNVSASGCSDDETMDAMRAEIESLRRQVSQLTALLESHGASATIADGVLTVQSTDNSRLDGEPAAHSQYKVAALSALQETMDAAPTNSLDISSGALRRRQQYSQESPSVPTVAPDDQLFITSTQSSQQESLTEQRSIEFPRRPGLLVEESEAANRDELDRWKQISTLSTQEPSFSRVIEEDSARPRAAPVPWAPSNCGRQSTVRAENTRNNFLLNSLGASNCRDGLLRGDTESESIWAIQQKYT